MTRLATAEEARAFGTVLALLLDLDEQGSLRALQVVEAWQDTPF